MIAYWLFMHLPLRFLDWLAYGHRERHWTSRAYRRIEVSAATYTQAAHERAIRRDNARFERAMAVCTWDRRVPQ